jgi:predicted enzyme related to lactoylglutathione lyase
VGLGFRSNGKNGRAEPAFILEERTMAKLFRVILPVTDIEKAAKFYASVFGSPGARVSPGRHYFDCGGTVLACYDPVADGDGLQGGWKHHPLQYVYFSVPDLEAKHRVVSEAGCQIVEGGIQKMPWGERMFWANDPFGNPISFVDESTIFTGGQKPSFACGD